jgi:hypothetical protein
LIPTLSEVIPRLRFFFLLATALQLRGDEHGRVAETLVDVDPLLLADLLGRRLDLGEVLFEERPDSLHRDPDGVGRADQARPHDRHDDADDPSRLVDDRPTAIARIDVGVEQERAPFELRIGCGGDRPPRALQLQAERRATGIAEDHDLGAALRHCLSQRHRLGLEPFDPQQREVGILRLGHERGEELLVPILRIEDRDVGRPLDDMVVGEHIPRGDDEAGAIGDADDDLIWLVEHRLDPLPPLTASHRPARRPEDAVGKHGAAVLLATRAASPAGATGARRRTWPPAPPWPPHGTRAAWPARTARSTGASGAIVPLLAILRRLGSSALVEGEEMKLIESLAVELIELVRLIGRDLPQPHHAVHADRHGDVVGHRLEIGHDLKGATEVLCGRGVALQEHLADGEIVVGKGVVRFALHNFREVGHCLEVVVGDDRIDEAHHEVGPTALGVEPTGGHEFLLGEVAVVELEELVAVADHLVSLFGDAFILLFGHPPLPEAALLPLLHHLPLGKLLLSRLAHIGGNLRIGEENLVDLHRFGCGAARLRIGFELLERTERGFALGSGLLIGISVVCLPLRCRPLWRRGTRPLGGVATPLAGPVGGGGRSRRRLRPLRFRGRPLGRLGVGGRRADKQRHQSQEKQGPNHRTEGAHGIHFGRKPTGWKRGAEASGRKQLRPLPLSLSMRGESVQKTASISLLPPFPPWPSPRHPVLYSRGL